MTQKDPGACMPASLVMRVVLFLPNVCVNIMFFSLCLYNVDQSCLYLKYMYKQHLKKERESLIPVFWYGEMGKLSSK